MRGERGLTVRGEGEMRFWGAVEAGGLEGQGVGLKGVSEKGGQGFRGWGQTEGPRVKEGAMVVMREGVAGAERIRNCWGFRVGGFEGEGEDQMVASGGDEGEGEDMHRDIKQ